MSTLTSANSVLTLGVANLFNVPVKIEGYAADDAFTATDVETGETLMGVDGNLSGGFTPYPVPIEITLQSDSASILFFETLIDAEAIAREKYIINGSILIPSVGFIYALTRGFLGKVTRLPGAKKILQPRKFEITFQNVTSAPIPTTT